MGSRAITPFGRLKLSADGWCTTTGRERPSGGGASSPGQQAVRNEPIGADHIERVYEDGQRLRRRAEGTRWVPELRRTLCPPVPTGHRALAGSPMIRPSPWFVTSPTPTLAAEAATEPGPRRAPGALSW